jgi:hypothetical protein
MRSTLLKLSVTLVLVIATAFATSQATSQFISGKPKPKAEAKIAPVVTVPGIKKSADPLTSAASVSVKSFPVKPIFQSHLERFKIEPVGFGAASVEGDVQLTDNMGINNDFLWRVMVYENPNGISDVRQMKQVADASYAHQKFKIERGTTKTYKFHDLVHLQPDKYCVVLALYRLPDGFDHTVLMHDEVIAKTKQILKVGETVSIE